MKILSTLSVGQAPSPTVTRYVPTAGNIPVPFNVLASANVVGVAVVNWADRSGAYAHRKDGTFQGLALRSSRRARVLLTHHALCHSEAEIIAWLYANALPC